MDLHPQHDLVVDEVRGWYTSWPAETTGPIDSAVGVDARSRREPFGYLREGPGPTNRHLVLTVDDPGEVRSALESAARFYGTESFDVWVNERQRAVNLDSVLTEAGFRTVRNTIVLALVGRLQSVEAPPDLVVHEVTDQEGLRRWSRVRLMGFSDSETEPSATDLDAQIAARSAEWPMSRYELAIVDGEPASILAHYVGLPDQMVFLLATRVPFRHRGIAQSLLRAWTERALGDGARSLLINCEEHGMPATLYRKMGFVDEVHWLRNYERTSPVQPQALG